MDVAIKRLERVQQGLQAMGADCLALVPGANLRWLTGLDFGLLERALIFFIPARQESVLLMPALEKMMWDDKPSFPARAFAWADGEGPQGAARRAAQALPAITKLAVEDLRMRVMEYRLLSQHFPQAQILPGEEVMAPLRVCKDAGEITAMRRAVEICEASLEEVVSGISQNATEREIACQLSSALLLHGADSVPGEPQVLSGPRSALPHGGATDRRIAPGELLLFDFVATVEGYYADLTRTFVIGREPDEQQRRVYQAVLDANAAGRELIRPGVACEAVDREARSRIEGAGYGERFIHRAGHGLGLEVHEPPYLVGGNEMRLQAGMVVTMEPGIYIEGWGGVRIEDDVVVQEGGSESLSTFDRSLRVIGA